jgi:thioredoxin reductase (NADPH)
MPSFDCAVIGGGPAGLTAALYLQRFRRKVVLIQNGTPRAAWIPKTKNLTGYQRGISGKSLLRRMHLQIAEIGVPIKNGKATVKRGRDGFLVEIGGRALNARKVILATGIEDKQPEIPNLELLRRRGLLRYCPICDGFEHARKKLFLFVGESDSLDKIRFLLKYTPHLLVIGPKNFPLSSQRRKIYRRLNVNYVRAGLRRIQPLGRGIKVSLDNGKTYKGDAGYVELGFHVNDSATAALKKLRKTKSGCLITDKDQRTSIPGLFAVGDCTPGLAQIAVAAGQAAIAATAVHNELLEVSRPGRRK